VNDLMTARNQYFRVILIYVYFLYVTVFAPEEASFNEGRFSIRD